jgi:hypothetical protein
VKVIMHGKDDLLIVPETDFERDYIERFGDACFAMVKTGVTPADVVGLKVSRCPPTTAPGKTSAASETHIDPDEAPDGYMAVPFVSCAECHLDCDDACMDAKCKSMERADRCRVMFRRCTKETYGRHQNSGTDHRQIG